MKKVLFIAYLYPPIFNSGTRRSLEFANHLPDTGWEPIVLTVADPAPKHCDPTLLDEIRPGTRIERVPLWSDWAADKLAATFALLFDRRRMAERLAWRLRRLWQVPDECALWWPLAVRRAEEIYRKEGFDVIYATGWPWTSFLIAAAVSRRTGRPYVLDYRDFWKPAGVEWDRPTWLQRWLNPWLEKHAIGKAAAVVSVTPSFLRELSASTGRTSDLVCITNGFDPDDFPLEPPSDTNIQGLVKVVYTGVWRPGYGPEDLYLAVKHLLDKATQGLERLRIVVAGFAPGRAKEYGIAQFVEELGPVPHAQAINLMAQASVLYLPVSKGLYEQTSLPGKLFEYLGSGRPILASASPDSEVAVTLDGVGGARCVAPGDIQALASVLEALCGRQGSALFSPRIPDEVARYTRSSLTRKLASVLDSAVHRRGLVATSAISGEAH